MRYLCLLIALVCVFVAPASAQDDAAWWDDGCDPQARAVIDPTVGGVDYEGACAVYRACDPNAEGNPLCQLRAFQHLVAACAPDDRRCEQTAALYAAAILMFDLPLGESVDFSPPQSVITGVPAALAAFQAGDDTAAYAGYAATSPDDFRYQAALPLSRAIVEMARGNTDAALRQFSDVFAMDFTSPLASYMRARLYASEGRMDEASWDAATVAFAAQSTPELANFVGAFAAQYPLDTAVMGDWLGYPVMQDSFGPAGGFYYDITLLPPAPVRIGIYDDLDRLFAIDLDAIPAAYGNESDAPPSAQILRLQEDTESYALDFPSYYDEYTGGITLTSYGDTLLGWRNISFFEGSSSRMFLLAPADAPDPRANLAGTRHCEGGVISRVQVGQGVESAYYAERTQLYDAPDGSPTTLIDAFVPLTITAGPTCVGSVTWWQVADDAGNVGWLAENEDNQYRINPSSPWLFYCPAAPEPRLYAGAQAVVVASFGANNVRVSADGDSAEVGQLAEGATFTVIDGPVCADGYVWWKVAYDGGEGWTAEGEGDNYWLELTR
jgi:hypothetical protein